MRRTAAISLACAAGAVAAAAGGGTALAAGTSSPTTPKPRSAVRIVCHPKRDSLTAIATMRPIAGTQKLRVRFDLEDEASGAPPFAVLATAGLGIWLAPTSPPTLGQQPGDVWRVKQPVAGLAAGDSYRVKVSFRWIGAHDKLLKSRTRMSRACSVPAARYPSA